MTHSFFIYIVLHSYFGLAYIKIAWGGEEERLEEVAKGNMGAKNWQDEALKVLETTVREHTSTLFRLSD